MRIQDLMRAASVKRWTIVTTSRDESLAEHSFLVTILAMEIAKRAELDSLLKSQILEYAVTHDLGEILTGDVPTPAKEKGLISVADDGSRSGNETTTTTVRTVVKAADLIQAWWFISQWGTGRHAEEVSRNCFLRLMTWFEGHEGPNVKGRFDGRHREVQWAGRVPAAAWSVFTDLQQARHEV